MRRAICVSLIGTVAGISNGEVARAQSPWPAPPPIEQRWPGDPPATQQRPIERAPARAQQPTQPDAPAPRATRPPPKQAPAKPAQTARAITCASPFAKTASHLALAARFGAENITFTDVEGPGGSLVKASVLYPKDPKRRLEIWWSNEGARADTSLIVINGQSTWSAPKGVRLGLTLAAIEKLNGKPFLLSGYGVDNSSSVTDWQGGALASLLGGCKMSVRFSADAKAPTEARNAVAGDKSFPSSDVNMRAVSPKAIEILIGY